MSPCRHRLRPLRTASVAMAVACLLPLCLSIAHADDDPAAAERQAHAAHHATVREGAIRRMAVDIRLPEVTLVRDDGRAATAAEVFDDGHPVYVDFIYTTCTAICPVTSATFAALQQALGSERDKVRMVSISIDPEEDTPRRLAEFRRKYGAGPQWHHYTGTAEASVAVQRAFGVFTGDKMGHTPVTMFRAAPGRPWMRLDGFATPDELLHEYRATVSGR